MVQGGTAVQVGIVLVTVIGLWVGARLLVDSAVRLARRVGLTELTIGLTVVAVGTSTPELVVTTDAALKGLGDIGVGNVIGSNIYNLAFILGVVSLVRFVPVERSLVHRDGVALVVCTLLGGVVLFDLAVSRIEGVALLGLLLAYTVYLVRTGAETASDASAISIGSDASSPGSEADRPGVATTITDRIDLPGRDVVLLVVGLAVVLVSGDLMVGAATALARGAGVSEWVIGGTIVAAGTSTPEFAVSLVAMRRGRIGVSVGNIVGSNVFNLLGVMGLAAVIRPLSVGGPALENVAWLVVVTVAMVAALWTGRRLSRPEGGLFACSELTRWTLGLLGVFG
ncbi:calcium/sodium antiporter [Salinirubellus sp. GCM10025818]|uniref:calcium/sodium antiporter n=1 Tax=Salinirubellus TaxID=2162630 RepID=UPI0030CC95A4